MYPIYRKRVQPLDNGMFRGIVEQKDGRRAQWVAIDCGRETTFEDAKLDAKNLFAMYGDGEGHA